VVFYFMKKFIFATQARIVNVVSPSSESPHSAWDVCLPEIMAWAHGPPLAWNPLGGGPSTWVSCPLLDVLPVLRCSTLICYEQLQRFFHDPTLGYVHTRIPVLPVLTGTLKSKKKGWRLISALLIWINVEIRQSYACV